MVITRGDTVGGSQTHVLDVTRAMRASGHDARIFLGGEGEFTEVLDAADIPYEIVEGMRRALSPLADMRAYYRLKRTLRAFAPDLVSTHSTKAAALGNWAGRALKIPVVFTAHGWQIVPGGGGPRQLALRWGHRLTALPSARVICVCDYDRALAVEQGVLADEMVEVVHNSVPDVGASLRAESAGAPPHLITVTRLAPPKDVETLIRALATLRDRAWTMEVVGDGPMRLEVEKLVTRLGLEDRVTLSGTCGDVEARLARSQIFVLSTDREGFPMSVLEAMRAGLPVVASDVGGIREAVAHGVSGAVVPARSPELMAQALGPLIDDAAMRASYGAAGRRRFEESFAFETQTRKLWVVYRGVIGAHRERTQ